MKKVIAATGVGLLPMLAFAQASNISLNNLQDVINGIGKIINAVVPLIFAVAVLYMLWNIVKYIEAGTGDAKARDSARDQIIFAVVLLFVMMSIWGLVNILRGTFRFDTTDPTRSVVPFR
jgi:succinate dehydrogenase hydrophobic anchor subunit